MADKPRKLHIVMLPWLAFGHLTPFLELAKLIAQRGHTVSFISTPRNIHRLPKIPTALSTLINFVALPLNGDNLPESAESTMDLPYHLLPLLKKALDGLQDGVARFLQDSSPDWVLYDYSNYWLPPIAAKLGISRAFLCTFAAWSSASFHPAKFRNQSHGEERTPLLEKTEGDNSQLEPEKFTVTPRQAPFPTTVGLKRYESEKVKRIACRGDNEIASDMYRFMLAISACEVIFIRTCIELEPAWLGLLGEINRKPVVPVGLFPPALQVSRANNHDAAWERIESWLDKREKGSVVYIALGTEANPSQKEFTELALGIEQSGLPFFWALRKRHDSLELPEGYEDRVRDRGFVCTSWVPQVKILNHESVGGFLTHCGWISLIEGLHFRRPLIMFPQWGDQWLNARAMEEKKVGMEVPRNEEDGSVTRNSVAESVRMVMVEKREVYRESVEEMSKIFRDKNLQSQYADKFVEYLQNHRKQSTSGDGNRGAED